MANETKEAYFAGGCFWCVEAAFDYVSGVKETISGYMGGEVENPTYQQIGTGKTGHVEALKVVYDPSEVSYDVLLETFWQNIDPLDEGGQFADRGSQYQTVIFYQTEEEKHKIEASKQALEKLFKKDVVTKIYPFVPFYEAEEYHQNYHQKNPLRYEQYKHGSGRPERLDALKKEKLRD